jgi:CubicO group peptidase (beta-lactamase class C family)
MRLAAGCPVEKLAGRSWEEFVRSRIPDPLGLAKTNLSVTDSKKSENHDRPYGEKERNIVPIPFKNIDAIGPAGPINASVDERTRRLLLHLNGGRSGESRITSEEGLKRIHAPVIVTPGEIRHSETGYASCG